MAKADDSSLDPEELRAVQSAARRALDRASAWGVYPTPTADILDAARLKIAPKNAFDPRILTEYLLGKAESAASALKSAIAKVLGIYDAGDRTIHIDDFVHQSKQNFLMLHEAGHHEIPSHRNAFQIFQDCAKTLDPTIADLFEREANNFARFVLFQGDGYAGVAADHQLELRTPIKLARTFGASVYSSCREFVRTHHRACAVYVLEPVTYCERTGARAEVRRIEASLAYLRQFRRPDDLEITLNHSLGRALPIGGKMTRPIAVSITDRNGHAHECVAEAFNTGYNVLLLVYPVKALSGLIRPFSHAV